MFQSEILPIANILTKEFLEIAVILLGSRARGNAKKYSDWDMGVTLGKKQLSTEEYFKIKNRVEDLSDNLPRSVDVINLDVAPSWFLRKIDYDPPLLDGQKSAYIFFLGVLHGIKKQR
jgi:predicted nucleotidyltransferase